MYWSHIEPENGVSLCRYQEEIIKIPLVHPAHLDQEHLHVRDVFLETSNDIHLHLTSLDDPIDRDQMEKDMGTVLQCLAKICDQLELDLSEVARKNLVHMRGV